MRLEARKIKISDFVISPYLKKSNLRGTWQLLSTVLPIIGIWVLIHKIGESALTIEFQLLGLFPLISLLILLSSRCFSLMHDCGHDSFFESKWLNRASGFFLGVINAIPQHPWSRGHAFHHKHNGNWELYRGPSALLTLKKYHSLNKFQRSTYNLSRHPIMLFPGGFFYLIIKPRLALIIGVIEFFISTTSRYISARKSNFKTNLSFWKRAILDHNSNYWYTSGEFYDLIGNNILVISSWIIMSKFFGFYLFWSVYSIVMTISAAIFICVFFVQHNFEGSYAHGSNDWSYIDAALDGSSNLDIPSWLNWFFADISFHSMHHLCEKIPNYNLKACHYKNKDLLVNTKRLGPIDIPKCFAYIIWDENLKKLITIREANLQLAL